ncbi:MAG: rod shape-determining protein MreD [Hyphomicrobiaceae bacterium]|nr:rod shape-determining protein MreD [Hyphomicrobiaceae bacterium]
MNASGASLAAFVALALALAAAVVPWPGGGAAAQVFATLLPALVIHYWTLRGSDGLPVGVAFAAGLVVDVLSGGPLGFWALVYVAAWLAARLSQPWRDSTPLGRWALTALAIAGVVAIAWAVASLWLGRPGPIEDLALGGLWAGLLYPLLAAPLRLLAGPAPRFVEV